MIFHETGLPDARLIELEPHRDDRGFFGRIFCADEFASAGLEPSFCQMNNSYNARAGTLRGLHYQLPPAAETKLVRCIRGSLWDCIVDLRPQSPTFLKSFGAQLDDQNRLMMYVPTGFAHGFLTRSDDTEVFYASSAPYHPARERGLRWDDPHLAIEWPTSPSEISPKDAAWPDLEASHHGVEAFRTPPGFAGSTRGES